MSKTPSKVPPPHPESDPSSSALSRAEATVELRLREKVEQVIGPIVGGSQRVQIIERVTQMLTSEAFRGPLPHPKHLQAYEEACSGSADRIIRMAEIAQERREARRDKILDNEFSDRRFGMILGFSALAILVIAGTVIIALGHVAVGSSLLGTAVLGTVVGTFVHGRKSGPSEKKTEPTKAD